MRIFLFLFLFISFSHAADDAFHQALAAYKAGQIQTALTEFKKIAEDEKQISAALCHNIANCEYRLAPPILNEKDEETAKTKADWEHYGQASIWYRRALALDPRLPEAQQNLRFLEKYVGFHVFKSEGFWDKYAGFFTRSRWRTIAFACIWSAIIAIVWLAWATPRSGRRWPLVTLLSLSAFLGLAAGTGLGLRLKEHAPSQDLLVNKVYQAVVRSAPAEAANTVVELKPGSELLPLREPEGNWRYVEIPGPEGDQPTRGWVRTVTTEKLWPWAPSLID